MITHTQPVLTQGLIKGAVSTALVLAMSAVMADSYDYFEDVDVAGEPTYQVAERLSLSERLGLDRELSAKDISALLRVAPQLAADLTEEERVSIQEAAKVASTPAKFQVEGTEIIDTTGGLFPSSARAGGNFTDTSATGSEVFLNYDWSGSFGSGGMGVYARESDGLVEGKLAIASSGIAGNYSYGSFGVSSNTIGTNYGVYGRADGAGATNNYGVYGSTNQAAGYGGYFTNTVATGANYSQALYVKGGGTNNGDRTDPRAYAATIEATENLNAKMLAIYLSTDEASSADYYIGFLAKNRAGTADRVAGEIRGVAGTSENGIQLISNAADFAEFLPRSNPDEKMEAGDVVGVVNGRISRDLSKAHNIQVISSAPIVAGNMPEPEQEHLYESVAFVGQVPVKVIGKVVTGDYIVASGKNDGTAVAISPANMTPEQFRLAVGQAWESSDEMGVKLVNTAVGLVANDTYAYMKKQDQRIASLEQQLSEKMARLDRLAAQMESLTQKVAYIQSANMTAKVE